MKRKPKITDVAKASGFSIATVSHVINGSRPVSAETAAKVNAAIAALGYVPDSSARSFKTGRHHLVGYIAPDIGNRFFSLILEELEDALALRGYNLLVINTRENGQRELDGFQVLTNGLTDGVICASTFQDYADLKTAIPKNFPLVMIDRLPKNYSGDSVRVSCYDAIREAIHALVQVGHRRIGLIASIGRLSTTVERLNAYCDALKEEGIEVDPALIKQGDSRSRSGYDCMRELVDDGVGAVLISNSVMAGGAISLLDSRHMIIGKDIQVAALRDYEWHRFQQENVHTVEQPARDMAKFAAQLLLDRIEDPSGAPREVILKAAYHAGTDPARCECLPDI